MCGESYIHTEMIVYLMFVVIETFGLMCNKILQSY
jgi:hypothetical protein